MSIHEHEKSFGEWADGQQLPCNHESGFGLPCGKRQCPDCGAELTLSCEGNDGACPVCATAKKFVRGGLTRLEVYDQLRRMHRLLKDIPDRTDEWETCVLETVAGVLYLAECEFCREKVENHLVAPGKQEAARLNGEDAEEEKQNLGEP